MCWPKTNRLPDISPEKNRFFFFKFSRESQFRVCHHGHPLASPHMAKEGETFTEGKRQLGEPEWTKNPLILDGWVLARRGVFLFPNELCSPCRVWKHPSLCNCGFWWLILQMAWTHPSLPLFCCWHYCILSISCLSDHLFPYLLQASTFYLFSEVLRALSLQF